MYSCCSLAAKPPSLTLAPQRPSLPWWPRALHPAPALVLPRPRQPCIPPCSGRMNSNPQIYCSDFDPKEEGLFWDYLFSEIIDRSLIHLNSVLFIYYSLISNSNSILSVLSFQYIFLSLFNPTSTNYFLYFSVFHVKYLKGPSSR